MTPRVRRRRPCGRRLDVVVGLTDHRPVAARRKASSAGRPPSRDRHLRIAIQDAASLARDEATASRDPCIVGVARVLDALELALRRGRAEAGDVVRDLEKIALELLSTRRDGERWYGWSPGIEDHLPSRAGVDRAERVRWLLRQASVALRMTRAKDTATVMVACVYRCAIVDTRGRDRRSDVNELAPIIARRRRPGLARKLDAAALVALGLKACGVSHATAHNWLKIENV